MIHWIKSPVSRNSEPGSNRLHFFFFPFFARWGLLRLDGDLREQIETGARAGRRSGLQSVETLVDSKLSGETERGGRSGFKLAPSALLLRFDLAVSFHLLCPGVLLLPISTLPSSTLTYIHLEHCRLFFYPSLSHFISISHPILCTQN